MGNAKFLMVLLFAALLSNAIFAGYREKTIIRVWSKSGYAVEGAEVSVTYEITRTRGMFTAGPKTTNSTGKVYFDFSNSEFNKNDTNLDYTVSVKFGGATGSGSFKAGKGEYPRTITVDAHLVTIFISDKDGKPLSVPVSVGNLSKTSDSGGGVFFIVPEGEQTVSASYRGIERKLPLDVKGDMYLSLTIKLYNASIRVLDDNGAPLATEVYVGAQQKYTDSDGYARFDDIFDPQSQVSVYWGKFKKVVPANLGTNNQITIYFDTHPPNIGSIEAQWKDRFLQVRAAVNENTTHASGMRTGNASVRLVYTTISGGDREVPMYAVGYNFYEGLIPISGTEAQIKYTVVAQDADGNRKTSSDTFVLPTTAQGGRPPGSEPPEMSPLGRPDQSMLIIVGIGIVVIIAGVTLHYYQEHLSVGKQPPMASPPPPSEQKSKPSSPPPVPPVQKK